MDWQPPASLVWSTDAPPQEEGRPLLFYFGKQSYDVLMWSNYRQCFCQNDGGWGTDRYSAEEIGGVYWADLTPTSAAKPR